MARSSGLASDGNLNISTNIIYPGVKNKLENNKNDTLYFGFGSTLLEIPEDKSKTLKISNMVGKEIILGVRPEDIEHEGTLDINNKVKFIESKVEVAELLGSETYLYVDAQGNRLIVRIEPKYNYKFGDTIKLFFNMNKVHFFNKESEEAIF